MPLWNLIKSLPSFAMTNSKTQWWNRRISHCIPPTTITLSPIRDSKLNLIPQNQLITTLRINPSNKNHVDHAITLNLMLKRVIPQDHKLLINYLVENWDRGQLYFKSEIRYLRVSLPRYHLVITKTKLHLIPTLSSILICWGQMLNPRNHQNESPSRKGRRKLNKRSKLFSIKY